VSKSGTKELHGGGRYFHRHESLNANNYFRNAQGRDARGVEIQPRNLYRYNSMGYEIGGPVWIPGLNFNKSRDKLFFYWNQEWYEQLAPQAARNIQVPTGAERNGDFSQTTDGNGNRIFISDPTKVDAGGNRLACGAANTVANPGGCFLSNGQLHVIPANRYFASGQAILNLYPAANVAGNPLFNYTSAISTQYPRREDILRVDWTLRTARGSRRVIRNNDEGRLLAYGDFATV
jgi:hypothetical protein